MVYERLLEQPVDENVAPSRHSSSGTGLPGGAHCGTGGRSRSSPRSRTVRVERDLTPIDRPARISIECELNFLPCLDRKLLSRSNPTLPKR